MNESELLKEVICYPKSLLDAWENGDYSMLTDSKASNYIKSILLHKARLRPGRRFFGEAYIASKSEMRQGWYSSFKWLTSDKWLSGHGLDPKFEKPFHYALMKYMGIKALAELQGKVTSFCESHKAIQVHGKGHKKPVAPDLWIIDPSGRFRFIEIKLPGDTIKPHQIAGLALIKKYLKVPKPVSVSIEPK